MADFQFATARLATGAAIVSASDVDQLIKAGITHVIDCWGEEDHSAIFNGTPILHMRPPATLDDGTPKPSSWFAPSLDFALKAFSLPHARVLAHCAGGINRGPSTAYAVLRSLGFTPAAAESSIRTCRPQVQLRYKGDADAAVAVLGYL